MTELRALCESILADRLASWDLTWEPSRSDERAAMFTGPRHGLRLSYWREDAPPRALLVTLHLMEEDEQAPLWTLEPGGEAAASRLVFNDEEELVGCLQLLDSNLWDRLIAPAFTDPERIRRGNRTARAFAESHREGLMDQQDIRRARRAFDSGDYGAAVAAYVLLGTDQLSAVDRKRYEIALRRSM